MATSGLDDEVKVWSPSSQNRVERSYVEKAVMKNADKSARDTYGQGSIISGQMLWQILRQMRRSERRRGRQEEETDDQDHSSSDDDDDDSSDDLDDGPVQCAQSWKIKLPATTYLPGVPKSFRQVFSKNSQNFTKGEKNSCRSYFNCKHKFHKINFAQSWDFHSNFPSKTCWNVLYVW